jgi:hypothetical protein
MRSLSVLVFTKPVTSVRTRCAGHVAGMQEIQNICWKVSWQEMIWGPRSTLEDNANINRFRATNGISGSDISTCSALNIFGVWQYDVVKINYSDVLTTSSDCGFTGKGKVVTVLFFFFVTEHRSMKACWGSGCIVPHISDIGTRWRWVVSFTRRLLCPQRKSLWYPLDRRLGGPQNRFGRGDEKETF